MTIDIQALTEEAGFVTERMGDPAEADSWLSIRLRYPDESDCTDEVVLFANAVLEAVARRLETAAVFSDNLRAVERCAAECRAMKVTP